MFNTPLFLKLYAGFVAVILISTIIVSVQIGRQVEQNNIDEIEHSLHIQAIMLSQLFPHTEDAHINEKIVALGARTNSRLTLIDVSGNVIADSQNNRDTMDNHIMRPEIRDAKLKGSGHTTRYSNTLKKNMRYLALPVYAEHLPEKTNNTLSGYVRVSVSIEDIEHKISSLRKHTYWGAAISALFALILGFYFSRRLSKPIEELTSGAEAIAQGDYSLRIRTDYQGEIRTLGKAFNHMAISAEKRVDELVADKNRLATILSGMVEGVVAIDHDEKIIHINEAAARLLGMSSTASLGLTAWEVIRIPEIHQLLKKILSGSEVKTIQVQIPGGTSDTVIDVYGASLQAEGINAGAVLVLHNISELHRLERVRQDFVSNASHELKTPVTAIRGIIETILDDERMPEDTRKNFLNKAHIQTERLTSIVSDLMALSRLEARLGSHSEVAALENHTLLTLNEIINQSLRTLRTVADEKNISITAEINSNIRIRGERHSLEQLFDNLIDNGIKYTPSGGQIDILATMEKDSVVIVIHDNGSGISTKDQQRIFERFYRVDKGRSRELGGTGLGLAIVKHIVEQHEGTITVDSDYGKGTRFTITLPKA